MEGDTFSPSPPRGYIARRYVILALLTLGLLLAYAIRVVLSTAIVNISKEQDWSSDVQGIVLSSFYWGYIITQLPGGYMASRWGGKWVFGVGMIVALAGTAVFPFVTKWVYAAVAVRIVTGIGEGVMFSSAYAINSAWAPNAERSTMFGFLNGAPPLGTLITLAVSPPIISSLGWKWLFWGTSAIGAIWTAFYLLFVQSTPKDNFFICAPHRSEIDYISTNVGPITSTSKMDNISLQVDDVESFDEQQKKDLPVPWLSFFRSSAFLAAMFNHFAYNWNYYVFVSWLPTYMERQLGFDLEKQGFYSTLPYLIYPFISMFSGWFCDWLVHKKGQDLLTMRKVFQMTSTFFACGLVGHIVFYSNGSV
eukprot:TRINITY_DN2299_c0_g1_i4.p1 TRINITY_DN2299_c0_g1~~TRINITY_DN2299_c0_g1_i4.p1  ORF type:complete len:364 (-),score=57.02 TRINITY_DN2299_c0_g1_i4:299-1390(-)